jgi:hypothetical protein
MKITAVYNREGKILAAAIVDDDMKGPVPMASKGTKAGTFEVPVGLRGLELHQLCYGHRIDVRESLLVEMKQSSKRATKKKKSR